MIKYEQSKKCEAKKYDQKSKEVASWMNKMWRFVYTSK